MIKMYTAFTEEIDDLQQAIDGILDQLQPEKNQLKNTIGIVYFHYEFASDDNLQKFAKAMPFKIAGCMSTYIGACGKCGDAAISVTMLTSNDVYFQIETIEDIHKKDYDQMRAEVKKVCLALCKNEKPKLVMPFLPTMPHFCGNDLMNFINDYDQSIMLFGLHVFNIDGTPGTNYVLVNGELSCNTCAMVAFYGEVNPKFRISSSFTFNEKFGETAELTDVDLSAIKSVNGISAVEFFKRQGLISPGNSQNMASLIAVPAILTYLNGSVVSCAFIGIDEENEYVIAARTLEAGAKIVLSQLDGEKTLASAKDMMREIKAVKENDFLAFSCAARVWAIGSNLFSEMQVIAQGAKEYEKEYGVPLNYSIAYSGGEICPILDSEEKYFNMVHNYTLVVCTFN